MAEEEKEPNKMHLYEIAEEYRRLLDDIEAGVIPDEAIADTLEAIEGELDDKLENVAVFIKELKAEAEALATEEAAIKARKQAKQKQAERMAEYLTAQMLHTGRKKLETPRAVISVRRSSSVEISDEAAFIKWAAGERDDLLTFKDPTISKVAIAEAIKAGEAIPYAAIVEKTKVGVK